jgi:hypothetical protein
VTSDLQRVDAVAGDNAVQLTQTVGYGYTLGNLSGVTYPSGRQLGLSWVDGEVNGLTLGGNALVTQIEWTPFAGAVKRWRWAMASGEMEDHRVGGPRLHQFVRRQTQHPEVIVFFNMHTMYPFRAIVYFTVFATYCMWGHFSDFGKKKAAYIKIAFFFDSGIILPAAMYWHRGLVPWGIGAFLYASGCVSILLQLVKGFQASQSEPSLSRSASVWLSIAGFTLVLALTGPALWLGGAWLLT